MRKIIAENALGRNIFSGSYNKNFSLESFFCVHHDDELIMRNNDLMLITF